MFNKIITQLNTLYGRTLKQKLNKQLYKELETIKYMIKEILKQNNKKEYQ